MNDYSSKDAVLKNKFVFKKKFGQNFISDTNLLEGIVGDSGADNSDVVVEIGCGAGTLTRELSKKAKRVIGYEIDLNLQPILKEALDGVSNVEIIYKDIMKIDIDELEKEIGEPYRVVANLPYYITTPVIMKFIEGGKNIKSLCIMVQEEVAKRIIAKEDTEDYGSITVAIDARADSKIMRRVNRKMFFPIPNVDSSVVRIDMNPNKFKMVDMSWFRNIVRLAFLNRRKTLVNNLILGLKIERIEAEEFLNQCKIDLRARGETLSTEKFIQLSEITLKLKNI